MIHHIVGVCRKKYDGNDPDLSIATIILDAALALIQSQFDRLLPLIKDFNFHASGAAML